MVILETDKYRKVNGYTRMEVISKETLIITSQKDQGPGISKIIILSKVNIPRSKEQTLTKKTRSNLLGKRRVK